MKLKTFALGTVVLALAAGVAYKTGHLKHPAAEAAAIEIAAAAKEIKRATGVDLNKAFGDAVAKGAQLVAGAKNPPAMNGQASASDSNQASSSEVCGVADRVADGKSFTLRAPANPALRVELAEIETPQSFHAYSKTGAMALEALIKQREVCLVITKGREGQRLDDQVTAWVWRKGDRSSINHQLVAGGHAYAAAHGLTDSSLLEHQTFAQRERRGMWAQAATPANALSARLSKQD